MKLAEKISMLEIRDYGHDDYVEDILTNINNIVTVANPKNHKHKKEIEQAIVTLLEEYHYDGELDIDDIESEAFTKKAKKEAEIDELKEIILEYEEIAEELNQRITITSNKLKNLKTHWL